MQLKFHAGISRGLAGAALRIQAHTAFRPGLCCADVIWQNLSSRGAAPRGQAKYDKKAVPRQLPGSLSFTFLHINL